MWSWLLCMLGYLAAAWLRKWSKSCEERKPAWAAAELDSLLRFKLDMVCFLTQTASFFKQHGGWSRISSPPEISSMVRCLIRRSASISFHSVFFSIFGYVCVYKATRPVMTSSHICSLWITARLSQPRLCMATDGQQWEWAADQLRPPVASWRRIRGTRSGSCRAGSEAPSPLARRGSCSCWWRRRSAGWSGRVRCVSLH